MPDGADSKRSGPSRSPTEPKLFERLSAGVWECERDDVGECDVEAGGDLDDDDGGVILGGRKKI